MGRSNERGAVGRSNERGAVGSIPMVGGGPCPWVGWGGREGPGRGYDRPDLGAGTLGTESTLNRVGGGPTGGGEGRKEGPGGGGEKWVGDAIGGEDRLTGSELVLYITFAPAPLYTFVGFTVAVDMLGGKVSTLLSSNSLSAVMSMVE